MQPVPAIYTLVKAKLRAYQIRPSGFRRSLDDFELRYNFIGTSGCLRGEAIVKESGGSQEGQRWTSLQYGVSRLLNRPEI
jgi:hypothetical protein